MAGRSGIAATPEPLSPAKRILLAFAAMLATLMQVLDTSIANVALPHMQATLNATQESVTWVLTSYILASAVATPLTGTLENVFGRRVAFTGAIAGFTLASALCGAAPTLATMVMARVLQGLFGALLLPLSQAVMLDSYPVEKRAKAVVIWSMATMIGPISGPVLGGIITENLSWRWVFYVNIPFGIFCVTALWLLLDPGKPARRPFDLFGFALLAIAFASLQLMLDRGTQLDWFDSLEIKLEAAVAVATFWMALVHTLTARAPLIPRALFRDRNFAMATGLTLIIVAVQYSSQALLAPMLQTLLHYNTQQAGMLLMPRGIGTMMAMLISGRLTGKVDLRILMIIGLATLSFSQRVMTGFDLTMDTMPVLSGGFLQGFGMGFVVIPLTMTAYDTLPARLRTDATAVFAMTRNLSASAAIAAMGALVAHNVQEFHADLSAHVTQMSVPLLDGRLIEQLGHAGGMVTAMLDAEINRQALMIAYLNDFWLMMWAALLAMPFVLMLRPPRLARRKPDIIAE
jgi:DHA2 family multidrug resistance protein